MGENKLISEEIIKEIKNKGLYNFNKTFNFVKYHNKHKKIISFYIKNNKDNKLFFENIQSKFSEGYLKHLSSCEALQLSILINEDYTIELDTFISFNNKIGSFIMKIIIEEENKSKKIINKNHYFREKIYFENNNFYIKKNELKPINNILLKYYDIIIKNYKEKIITIIQKNIQQNSIEGNKKLEINNNIIILGEDKIEANELIKKKEKEPEKSFFEKLSGSGNKSINYKNYNVLELKSVCKNKKIKKYSKLNKAELIKLLKNNKS